ncbi:MAG: hypothetical protein F7B60_04220 [Desulfurococcales archaeon]|nr:hypothetical protein [Desulfurococcales archaeon]
MIYIDKIKTGIPGTDGLIYSGIPKRNVALLSGDPSTGKTILSQRKNETPRSDNLCPQ